MADGFNINDRNTWAWTGEVSCRPGGPDYLLDPESPGHFYQCSNGVPYRHSCPADLVFNPSVEPGPVCDWPGGIDEAQIYEWAVAQGQVTDQR